MKETLAPIFGIERHRFNVDGKGITTLVLFSGCPLHCKYCINESCHSNEYDLVTPTQLFKYVRQDELYYLASGGGICFGGGEPLLKSDFIQEFCNLIPNNWHVTIETSLHVDFKNWERIIPLIDMFIVDIKSWNVDIYYRYTGGSLDIVVGNLKQLLKAVSADRIIVRVPLIPGYNDNKRQETTIMRLKSLGIEHIDRFEYIKPTQYGFIRKTKM